VIHLLDLLAGSEHRQNVCTSHNFKGILDPYSTSDHHDSTGTYVHLKFNHSFFPKYDHRFFSITSFEDET